MTKTISASDLRTRIRSVLSEVGYGRVDYVIEKFGEPIAAVVSIEDYRLLHDLRHPPAPPPPSTFERELAAIRAMLAADGYAPRTREEIDAELQAERESWGE